MTASQPLHVGFLQPTDPRWEAALKRAPHDLFHLPGYLEVAAAHESGTPLAFHLEYEDCGMLMPIVLRQLEGFGAPFTAYSDASSPYGYPSPIFWGEGLEGRLPEMLEAAWAYLREEKVVSLFLRMNPFLERGTSALALQADLVSHGPTVFIDLSDPDGSWAGINSANRSVIHRLHKAGHRVEFDNWSTYDTVIEAYTQTMHRLEASPFYFFPMSYFYGLRDRLSENLHLATSFTPDGEVTGGLVFSEVGGLVEYFLTGTFDAYRDVSPAKLIIDCLRVRGIELGHHTLNLGGGVGANQDGLFLFKSRFSKQVKTFQTLRKVLLPDVYEALRLASRGSAGASNGYFPAYRSPQ